MTPSAGMLFPHSGAPEDAGVVGLVRGKMLGGPIRRRYSNR